jgi:hypothetical protein
MIRILKIRALSLLALAALMAMGAQTAAAGSMADVKVDTVQNVSVKRFYGYAFDRSSGKYLYTEVQKQRYTASGRWLGGVSDYYLPDGKKIGEKTLDFSKSPFIPIYRLELRIPPYAEGISHVGEHHVDLFKVHDGKKTERKTIDRSPHMAADSGFDSYIQAHWKALMAGKTLHFVFAAAGLLNDYDLKPRKSAIRTSRASRRSKSRRNCPPC